MSSKPDSRQPAPVQLVISGCTAVTMDNGGAVYDDAIIAVSAGRIVWIGESDQAPAFVAQSRIDARGKLALPGMIDAHVHSAQQLIRGRIARLGRTRVLRHPTWKNYLIPFESLLTPDDVYLSALVTYTNMLQVGTTCFAEAGGPHPDEMGRAALEVGIRGFIAGSTLDQASSLGTMTPDNMIMTTNQAYDFNIGLVQRWNYNEQDRVRAWYALRQIIVCSPELITGIAKAAEENNTKIHTHLCEGVYEIDFAAEQFGMRPTEYLAELGVLSHRLHCAHSILLAPNEVDLYSKHRVSACHCALNNYATGHPRLAEMWRRGIDIGLGTDGVNANGTLDIFQVAHAARIGQQVTDGTPWAVRSAISGEELLKVATRGGARALGMGNEIGSLALGFRADILLCDINDLDHFPCNDPLITAAHTIVGRDVSTVIVDGKVVMHNREILTVDIEEVKARLRKRLPDLYNDFERAVA